MRGAIRQAEKIAEDPSFFMPQQFKNQANPEIHFRTTGPEIWNDTNGDVDVSFSGVGTGGTITGISRYFEKEKGKSLWSVAVEPATSPCFLEARLAHTRSKELAQALYRTFSIDPSLMKFKR